MWIISFTARYLTRYLDARYLIHNNERVNAYRVSQGALKEGFYVKNESKRKSNIFSLKPSFLDKIEFENLFDIVFEFTIS